MTRFPNKYDLKEKMEKYEIITNITLLHNTHMQFVQVRDLVSWTICFCTVYMYIHIRRHVDIGTVVYTIYSMFVFTIIVIS